MPKKIEKIAGIIFIVMLVSIFISSSMTYKQQTMVPTFSKYLTSKPLYGLLSNFHIHYDGADQSIQTVGYYKFVEFIIRKGAHFGSYFIMGATLWVATFSQVKSKLTLFMFSWLSVTGLASLDEFHQQLTGGRTPLVDDVMIDSCGALIGIIMTIIIFSIIYKTRRKKLF
ncbi:VanZ family protein [Companilactobacillus sp. DQM5]|uniref:VanZ family protein n=1 Tax=Companilactobacillus sp. DQM5 TaxID=3463359 RepID=UPI004057E04D